MRRMGTDACALTHCDERLFISIIKIDILSDAYYLWSKFTTVYCKLKVLYSLIDIKVDTYALGAIRTMILRY